MRSDGHDRSSPKNHLQRSRGQGSSVRAPVANIYPLGNVPESGAHVKTTGEGCEQAASEAKESRSVSQSVRVCKAGYVGRSLIMSWQEGRREPLHPSSPASAETTDTTLCVGGQPTTITRCPEEGAEDEADGC